MKRPWRVALKLSVLVALVGGVCIAGPGLARQTGLDFWNYPRVRAALDAELQRQKELRRHEDAIHRALAFRSSLTRDLLEGEISFDEAVAEFLAFNRSDPLRCKAVQLYFPAESLEESTRQQVLSFVRAQVGPTPDRHEDLPAELRIELQSSRPPFRTLFN